MKTPWDFGTLALFAALIVLFLQRSVGDAEDPHPMWRYLVPAVGCAVTNYLGNNDQPLLAVGVLVATLAYVIHVLRPFAGAPPR